MLTTVTLTLTYLKSVHVRMNALLLTMESSGLAIDNLNSGPCKLVESYRGCVALTGSFLSMLTIIAFIVLSFIKFVKFTPDQ